MKRKIGPCIRLQLTVFLIFAAFFATGTDAQTNVALESNGANLWGSYKSGGGEELYNLIDGSIADDSKEIYLPVNNPDLIEPSVPPRPKERGFLQLKYFLRFQNLLF